MTPTRDDNLAFAEYLALSHAPTEPERDALCAQAIVAGRGEIDGGQVYGAVRGIGFRLAQ